MSSNNPRHHKSEHHFRRKKIEIIDPASSMDQQAQIEENIIN